MKQTAIETSACSSGLQVHKPHIGATTAATMPGEDDPLGNNSETTLEPSSGSSRSCKACGATEPRGGSGCGRAQYFTHTTSCLPCMPAPARGCLPFADFRARKLQRLRAMYLLAAPRASMEGRARAGGREEECADRPRIPFFRAIAAVAPPTTTVHSTRKDH